jgi:hypothetical protein
MPLGAQPSAMLMLSMSVFSAGFALNSEIFVFAMFIPWVDLLDKAD